MTAPDRIWAWTSGQAAGIFDTSFHDNAGSATEYIRADLAQPAQGDYFEGLEEGIKIGRGEPLPDPAAIREAALREAAGLIADMSRIITHTDEDLGTLTGRNLIDPRKAAAAILALIGEKK